MLLSMTMFAIPNASTHFALASTCNESHPSHGVAAPIQSARARSGSMLLQGRRIMEHLTSLLTIQGSRLQLCRVAHPVRRASASMTISIPVVEAVARARILHNFLQTHQRFSNNGFKQRNSQQNQTLLFIR